MAKLAVVLGVILCICSVSLVNSRRTNSNSRLSVMSTATDDSIVFPDTFKMHLTNYSGRSSLSNSETTIFQMPLQMARRFNDVNNIEEFFSRHLDNKEDYYKAVGSEAIVIGGRFGAQSKGRVNSLPLAKTANCLPELAVVPLVPENTERADVFHLPSCTRVLRCGGCCNNVLLSCQPSEVGYKQFKIYELSQKANSAHYKKYINVTVEEHLKCKCDCSVKEKDCKGHQVYNANECRCVCKDLQTELWCSNQNNRYWDPNTCTCNCIDVSECSTGAYFDHQSCSCKRR